MKWNEIKNFEFLLLFILFYVWLVFEERLEVEIKKKKITSVSYTISHKKVISLISFDKITNNSH